MFFPTPVIGRVAADAGSPYDIALAAIPNKKFHARGDSSTAANGDSLSASPWDNEYGADIFGSATWETASLNSMRGIVSDASGEFGSSAATLNDLLPSDLSFTMFLVAKYSGTQGANSDAFSNSTIIKDTSNNFALGFGSASSRQLTFATTGSTWDTGRSISDGVGFVASLRISADGATARLRFNYGTTTANSLSLTDPTTKTGTIRINTRVGGDNRLYELLFCSDALSDSQMDDFHLLLQQKWGLA